MTAPALRRVRLGSLPPAANSSFDGSLATRIADQAVDALLSELSAWPKPGLVSHVDSGSHADMDAELLEASAISLRPFFAELVEAGRRRRSMDSLRDIGIRAEATMLSVARGVNTHRGAIFGLGLLCAAAGLPTTDRRRHASLGEAVARIWGEDIQRGPIPLFSHGSDALRRYGAGGARAEAAAGFPSVYEVGLPALREGRRLRPTEFGAAEVHACFALLATVEDTNLLHRGGRTGAQYAAEAAQGFLSAGGVGAEDWKARATAIHLGFVDQRLSPGGCADLLAMTIFVNALEAGGDFNG